MYIDELRLHKVFSLDFIQITYFVSISFQITYSLKCVYEAWDSKSADKDDSFHFGNHFVKNHNPYW